MVWGTSPWKRFLWFALLLRTALPDPCDTCFYHHLVTKLKKEAYLRTFYFFANLVEIFVYKYLFFGEKSVWCRLHRILLSLAFWFSEVELAKPPPILRQCSIAIGLRQYLLFIAFAECNLANSYNYWLALGKPLRS